MVILVLSESLCMAQDALVLSVMCVLLAVFTFCVMAMALTQRQWTHTADACWFDELTVTSRFYPYVIQNPQGAQMTCALALA